MKNKYYWTNPTADRHKAREIQLYIESQVDLILVSPFYTKDGIPTKEIKQLDNKEIVTVSSAEIVAIDKKLIRDCDGVVGWVSDKTSWGSVMEFIWAYEVACKPVYIIFQDTHNLIRHPWASEHSTRMFGTIEGFIAFAKENLV